MEKYLIRKPNHHASQNNNDDHYNETKSKLRIVLESAPLNNQHKEKILKLASLKDVHIYCKCFNLNSQFTGSIIEKYIIHKLNVEKNKSSLCQGDLKLEKNNLEIKSSNGGKTNKKFNYVQIRMNHCCDYLLMAYYIDYTNLENLAELFLFHLDKEKMKSMIMKHGSYAHGTISKLGKITKEDLNDEKNNKEYCLRPSYGDKCWMDLLKFRLNEFIV